MKRTAFIVFSLMWLIQNNSLYSQDLRYELSGSVRQWNGIFVQSPAESGLSETKIKLELTSTLGESAGFRILNFYTYDGLNRSGVLEFKEAYLNYYSSLVDIKFGKQIITWGKADELNPTDVLSPQNMSNILEDKAIRKTGLIFLRTDWNLDIFTLSAIWKPEFDLLRSPPANSRWAFFRYPGATLLPFPEYPDHQLKNSEWAFKLYNTIDRFDFTISWFDGWDNVFTPVLSSDPVPVISSFVFHRTRMLGADFASVAGSLGFWGEGGFFFTEDGGGNDPNIKNPYIQFVIGADYDFGNNYRFNIQYFQEVLTQIDTDTERDMEESIISKLGLTLPVQKAVSCRFEKKFGEGDAHKTELLALIDVKHSGVMLVPKFAYSPEDAFIVELGGAFFSGKSSSLFGRFSRNKEIYLKGTFSF